MNINDNLSFTIRNLTSSEHSRITALIPEHLLENVLKAGGRIAGGFVVYMCCPWVKKESVSDIDVFVDRFEKNTLINVATIIQNYSIKYCLTNQKRIFYGRHQSLISFYPEESKPIQIIASLHSGVEELLVYFDIDIVQCALIWKDGEIKLVISNYAEEAHQKRQVLRILDTNYNELRLGARLQKAINKGFTLNKGYKSTQDIPAKYVINDRDKQGIYHFRRFEIESKTLTYEEERNAQKNRYHLGLFDSFTEAMNLPFLSMNRDNYEGIETQYFDPPQSSLEELNEKISYIHLESNPKLNPIKSEINELKSSMNAIDENLRNKNYNESNKNEMERKSRLLWFKIRAYEYILREDYSGAVSSALSDKNKIREYNDISLPFMFLDMLMNEPRELSLHSAKRRVDEILLI